MKKVTLEINGVPTADGAKNVSTALNNLSGVVAAEAEGSVAYAYSGDRLQSGTLEDAVRKAGYGARVTSEEYLRDVNDFKNSMS